MFYVSSYTSLFSPFLQYSILVWGLTWETHMDPVFLLQKRVIGAISFGLFSSPSIPTFSNLKILRLHNPFKLKLLSFVHDCVSKISLSCFHSFFELVGSVHQYGTGQASKNNIFVTHKNTVQYGLRSVSYFCANCWNGIHANIKFPHLLVAFIKNSKPSSLKITTNHRSPMSRAITFHPIIKLT